MRDETYFNLGLSEYPITNPPLITPSIFQSAHCLSVPCKLHWCRCRCRLAANQKARRRGYILLASRMADTPVADAAAAAATTCLCLPARPSLTTYSCGPTDRFDARGFSTVNSIHLQRLQNTHHALCARFLISRATGCCVA